jgi:hypothetical protein
MAVLVSKRVFSCSVASIFVIVMQTMAVAPSRASRFGAAAYTARVVSGTGRYADAHGTVKLAVESWQDTHEGGREQEFNIKLRGEPCGRANGLKTRGRRRCMAPLSGLITAKGIEEPSEGGASRIDITHIWGSTGVLGSILAGSGEAIGAPPNTFAGRPQLRLTLVLAHGNITLSGLGPVVDTDPNLPTNTYTGRIVSGTGRYARASGRLKIIIVSKLLRVGTSGETGESEHWITLRGQPCKLHNPVGRPNSHGARERRGCLAVSGSITATSQLVPGQTPDSPSIGTIAAVPATISPLGSVTLSGRLASKGNTSGGPSVQLTLLAPGGTLSISGVEPTQEW